jgi:hypothetical protein
MNSKTTQADRKAEAETLENALMTLLDILSSLEGSRKKASYRGDYLASKLIRDVKLSVEETITKVCQTRDSFDQTSLRNYE